MKCSFGTSGFKTFNSTHNLFVEEPASIKKKIKKKLKKKILEDFIVDVVVCLVY